MHTHHILIVEDEPGIAESLRFLLERDHFSVEHAGTLAAARLALEQPTALVILDLGLPDGNGDDLLRQLRADGGTLPVIVLTSRSDEVDRIVGLELGADDYVSKPFSPREVVARVKAVLRRSTGAVPAPSDGEAAPISLHGIGIDPDRRKVVIDGTEAGLTKSEFDLLELLCRRPGHVYTRDVLLDRLWSDVQVTDRTVDTHIKSLRKKLRQAGADPDVVETVRGVGYRARE